MDINEQEWWLNPFFWQADLKGVLVNHEQFLHMQESKAPILFRGFEISNQPGIYHPYPYSSTCFLMSAIETIWRPGMDVLELGCGTAAIACVLAQREAKSVLATDCVLRALDCAKQNVGRLGNGKVEVMESDLFDSIVNRDFDLIVFNPPLLHCQPIANKVGYSSEYDRATVDPAGLLLKHFVNDVNGFLRKDGWAVVTISNICDFKVITNITRKMQEIGDVVVLRSLYNKGPNEWRFALAVQKQ